MKTSTKLYLTFFLALLLTGISTYESQAQVNIQAGLNGSSLRIESGGFTVETDGKPGFHIGAMYRKRISNSFFFSPGIMYSQKGASFFGEFNFNLNYLDVPLLFIYQKDPERGFFADFGLYAAALLSASSEGEDIKEGFNTADLGLSLGLGYDFGNIMVGLRGGLGFLNITKDDGTSDEGKAVNSNGQLYIAYKL